MGAAWVRGVQSQGVGTSLKHFACNNQEFQRMTVNVIADERTLHEIYLRPFEIIVKKEQPWTVMASYNRINGKFSCENNWLLNEVLRKQWGFKGAVISDWGAVNDRVAGVRAGMNLQMPGVPGDRSVYNAVEQGTLYEPTLDKSVEDILKITIKAELLKKENFTYDRDQHHKLARKAASESIILLKNEDSILPLEDVSKEKGSYYWFICKKTTLYGRRKFNAEADHGRCTN